MRDWIKRLAHCFGEPESVIAEKLEYYKTEYMKNKPFQARQGDVLIESAELPKAAVKQTGRVILAYGEVTSHAHEIHSNAEIWKDAERVYVRVRKATQLKHQEHAPIPVKRGVLKVTRQREYSPEAIRNVAD